MEQVTQNTNNPHVETVNPLLERAKMPGGTFTLPSGGIFYTNGELSPDVKNGEVYIHPMVTLDEITLRSPDKLFSGEGIKEVFGRCIPQVINPMKLLAKDVDFLLVCLRQLTYGDEMEVTYTHDCKDAKSNSYNIMMSSILEKTINMDLTAVKSLFTITLDNGQVLELEPPRLDVVLEIYQAAGGNDDNVDIETVRKSLMNTINGMIRSVDGITDSKMIAEWVEQIPAGWVHKISDSVEKLSEWGPSFNTPITCRDCEKEVTINTPVNPLAFFI